MVGKRVTITLPENCVMRGRALTGRDNLEHIQFDEMGFVTDLKINGEWVGMDANVMPDKGRHICIECRQLGRCDRKHEMRQRSLCCRKESIAACSGYDGPLSSTRKLICLTREEMKGR